MNWNLTCRKVRHSLALLSGNDLGSGSDLDAASQTAVRRHVAVCPQCRAVRQQLQAGQQALEQVRSSPRPLYASVWPSLERQLLAGDVQPVAAADWRGWLPTGALATACLTLLLAVPPTNAPQSPSGDGSVAGPAVIFPQSVGAPYWQLEDSSSPDRAAPRQGSVPLPDVPRVRILLDGTDMRGL